MTAVADRCGPAPNPQWVNSLKPKGKTGAELTLARAGKALYCIVTAAQPTTQETKAADDLAMWLNEMTGAKFKVVPEGDGAVSGKVISVGNTKALAQANLPESTLPLQNEGYAIAEKNSNLYLLGGKTRGIINAVYALLEEDLGCRWYDRASATIPHKADLIFRPVLRYFIPVLDVRDPFYFEAFDADWSLRNRTNAPDARVPEEWGGHCNYALFVHSFDTFVPFDKYYDAHPEYFSLWEGKRVGGYYNGQLCLTNPDVLKIVIDDVKKTLRGNPKAELISVSQNDNEHYCQCPNCKAIDDAEGSVSGSLMMFVNKVAQAIEGEFPKVKVITLAYQGTYKPSKHIRPRPNVAIQLCTDRHSYPHPFRFVTETDEFQKALKDWAATGVSIYVWDYVINFANYSVPFPNMSVVTDNIRFYIDHNAKGVMLQGSYQCPGGASARMKSWVWAKQLWDPSRDTRALMKDFVYGYYGKSAPQIWAYEDLLWRIWEKYHPTIADESKPNPLRASLNFAPNCDMFTQEFFDKAFALYDEAEKNAADPLLLSRVKMAKLPILYTKLLLTFGREGSPKECDSPADYAAMVKEIAEIVKDQKVTHFSEGGGDELVNYWSKRTAGK
ncbi:MAG: DUF4838 domain-containing protein [Armatimonadetes bacterium]|nr:DUF4838 domain-containing protein [Armatimonadota bacterium]